MERYLHYTIEDYAQDEGFIAWVLSPDKESDILWNDFIQSHPELSHKISSAKELVRSLSPHLSPAPTPIKSRVWSRIEASTRAAQTQNTEEKVRSINWWPAVAAACVLMFVAYTFFFDSGIKTVTTPLAMTDIISLPDGSKVIVNADSEVTYDEDSWSTTRAVQLGGEAFFEVEKGSTFKVITPQGDIQVLGTSFNVYARDSVLNVACESGKVAVSSGGSKTVITRDEAVNVISGIHSPIVRSHQRGTWRSGSYVYTGETLINVTSDLERCFGIKITMTNDLKEVKYTGKFSSNNLEQALAEVYWPTGGEYTISKNKVSVTKKVK